MKQKYSAEEMRGCLASDTGFRELLATMPEEQRSFILSSLLSLDFKKLISLLPAAQQAEVAALIDRLDTPSRALALYRAGRLREAKILVEEGLAAYDGASTLAMMPQFVTPVNFVALRAQSLLYSLLGDIYWGLGDTELAGDSLRHALELAEKLNDRNCIAKALTGLCSCHLSRGEVQEATSCSERAIALVSGKEDQWSMKAKALSARGSLFMELGMPEEALSCGDQSLAALSGDDEDTRGTVLNYLALICSATGDEEKALALSRQAFETAVGTGDLLSQAIFGANHASILLSTGDPSLWEEARGFLEHAVQIGEEFRSLPVLGQVYSIRAILHQQDGEAELAREDLGRATQLFSKTGQRSLEASSLFQMAILCSNLGEIEQGVDYCSSCIKLLEEMRGGLRREAHRMGFALSVSDPYAYMVNHLLCIGRNAEAVQYAERSKARTLVEILAAKILHEDAPVAVRSPEGFRRVKVLLREIEGLRKEVEAGAAVTATAGGAVRNTESTDAEDQSGALLAELEKKEELFLEAFNDLCQIDPEAASLISVHCQPVETLATALDEQTIIVELFQEAEQLRLFLIAAGGRVETISVPITLVEAGEIADGVVDAILSTRHMSVHSHDYIRTVRQPLSKLYSLLIGPIQPLIQDAARIIIVPHLFWHTFPFHALYDQTSGTFLADQFEIGYAPSAQVLHICRQQNRHQRRHALLMARNPDDLPHAEREVKLLAGAFYPDEKLFMGDAAYLSRVAQNPQRFDIIHLACHGHFDPEHPLLSSINLPPEASEERNTYLPDLLQLSLNCSLVTLSACDSGRTMPTLTDEFIGLGRGLFQSGAAAVLLSLWQVPDSSTCDLMEQFYWHYVKNGRDKTFALQKAGQAVRNQEKYRHPYFWAPFVVMGEWK